MSVYLRKSYPATENWNGCDTTLVAGTVPGVLAPPVAGVLAPPAVKDPVRAVTSTTGAWHDVADDWLLDGTVSILSLQTGC